MVGLVGSLDEVEEDVIKNNHSFLQLKLYPLLLLFILVATSHLSSVHKAGTTTTVSVKSGKIDLKCI